MELLFYPISLLLILTAFIWKKKGFVFFALAGNSVFALSLIYCIFDVSQRVSSGDFSGLMDIYSTMHWYYLVMFVLISILNIALLILKSKK